MAIAHYSPSGLASYCHTNASGVRRAKGVVRRPSKLKSKYSNILFYKTTGPTGLKFHMVHDLTPGSQNCKNDPSWPLLLKIAKITKSVSSPESLDNLG